MDAAILLPPDFIGAERARKELFINVLADLANAPSVPEAAPECGPCVAYHFESTATLWSECAGIPFCLLVHQQVR